MHLTVISEIYAVIASSRACPEQSRAGTLISGILRAKEAKLTASMPLSHKSSI
ncbi:MAG: hypothetical protein ACFFB3_21155 [Candidatus Hodarchaeota archaeon]